MTQPPLPPSNPFGQPLEQPMPGGRTGYLNPYTGRYGTKRGYAERMQRGYRRGLTQAEARGHPSGPTGESESQRRRRLAAEAGAPAPSFAYRLSADARLRRWGSSYAWYQRMYRLYINEINAYSSPGAKIGIGHVESQLAKGWTEAHIEDRLLFRLIALQHYHDQGDPGPGRQLYILNFTDVAPPEWWYYH